MPTVLRVSGFRFFFYSLEGSEPAHVHIEHGDSIAKFWLNPVLRNRVVFVPMSSLVCGYW
ncbi:MAG: DUF4160 domain-containing protein [Xanthobacteraceae bacterium]